MRWASTPKRCTDNAGHQVREYLQKRKPPFCSVEHGSLVVTHARKSATSKGVIYKQKATVCEASSTEHFPYATPENTNEHYLL